MPTAVHDAGRTLFLKRWLRRPLAMGAFLPSGPFLSEAIANATLSAMNGHSGYVIELGAGTGEVTKALLAAGIPADRLALVERDPELVAFLRRHFAGLKIIEGDAARLPRLLAANAIEGVAAVVSGLPLLSLPAEVVHGIVHGAFETLPPGGPMVQFTYGPTPPVPRSLRQSLKLIALNSRRIWRNVPPAVVWTFTRASDA
ncbi:class I SAM-dependent methyltransferase [Reyranella sp.]|jgi:phosphatidylethanolamine/phosphatidyl-N-methylethanolamine N-methyltransferase|uniref:class I SAM-dependent methyltransferase n=1 Tax=Reyranella sp. TaxID=1929291 RepID=UPI002F92EE4D